MGFLKSIGKLLKKALPVVAALLPIAAVFVPFVAPAFAAAFSTFAKVVSVAGGALSMLTSAGSSVFGGAAGTAQKRSDLAKLTQQLKETGDRAKKDFAKRTEMEANAGGKARLQMLEARGLKNAQNITILRDVQLAKRELGMDENAPLTSAEDLNKVFHHISNRDRALTATMASHLEMTPEEYAKRFLEVARMPNPMQTMTLDIDDVAVRQAAGTPENMPVAFMTAEEARAAMEGIAQAEATGGPAAALQAGHAVREQMGLEPLKDVAQELTQHQTAFSPPAGPPPIAPESAAAGTPVKTVDSALINENHGKHRDGFLQKN